MNGMVVNYFPARLWPPLGLLFVIDLGLVFKAFCKSL